MYFMQHTLGVIQSDKKSFRITSIPEAFYYSCFYFDYLVDFRLQQLTGSSEDERSTQTFAGFLRVSGKALRFF